MHGWQRRVWLWLRLAPVLCIFAQPAGAEMVKWVDANGTVHFAESIGEIPPQFRSQAAEVPSYSPGDERVRIFSNEPEEPEASGWWFGASEGREAAPPRELSSSEATGNGLRIPEPSFIQVLGLIVVQFFVSIFVLAACSMLIEERVENLGGKALGSIIAQRFLMFAALLWISHTATLNFVPQSISLGDIAEILLTPILAELAIMTVVLRFTICEAFTRAAVLSLLFCTIDAVAQGLLLFGAIIAIS